ncbi:PREDICTED: uncharacterized protein LOC104745311 [Camelina sativa]|uniref:Uncharacterized protein LOC104745311 n=1 Tax=Camelina sativa TaxID=90675 RepID=A0ABM0W2M2_CAMSA|nr:PREDICTED: uncharacterized protein LOC104745311 [Camelina sativa]
MPLNNNLRSVITQCRNFSTRSSRSSVVSNGSGRAIVASGGESKLKGFMSSLAYGNFAFGILASIELLEYRRTIVRDLEQRGGVAPSMLADVRDYVRDWLLKG